MAVGTSQIGSSARAEITAEINAHWRGAYDILVRPSGARLDLESTDGLVEPNFIGLTGRGGITLAELAQIRAIPGVEFAAPIGWVGLITTPTTAPSIEITTFPATPTLYEVTLRVTTSDGLSDQLVFSEVLRVLVAPAAKPGGPPVVLSDAGDVAILDLGSGRWAAEVSAGHSVPQLQSPIVAVDPAAERQLLGQAGSFLDPLVEIPDRDAMTVATTNPRSILDGYDQAAQIAAMQQAGGPALARPVLPVLVSSRTYAPVRVSVDVSQLGKPLAEMPDVSAGDAAALQAAAAEAGSAQTPIGSNSVDWAASMRALRTNGIGVPWPGTELVGGTVPAFGRGTLYQALLASRPAYEKAQSVPADFNHPAFVITPRGSVGPGGPLSADWTAPGHGIGPTGIKVGSEQSYRTLIEVAIPVAAGYSSRSPLDAPYVFAPVGEYNLTNLRLPHDPLDYVPFGAYDPPDASLIADRDGRSLSARPMSPTLNPAGLLSAPPMGIVDLHAAQLLRGEAPIDAVRVRVAGLAGYGADSLDAVGRVAAAIASLGLDVDVVAASSPQAVDVYVPGYEAAESPATDLGWVEEHWTTLGAAPRIERGLSDTNLALLILAVLGFGVVAATTELATAAARSREAGLLAAIGWRRRQVLRWQTGESLMGGVTAFALAATAWMVAGPHDAIGLAAATMAGASFAAFGLLGAWFAQPKRAGAAGVAPRWVSPPVWGPRSYALRSVAARPARGLIVATGVALCAGVVAPAAAFVAQTAQRTGPTALASALTDRMEPYQLGLLTFVAVAAFVCAALASRVDLSFRRREMFILEATGWTSSDRRRVLVWARLYLAVPAALFAAGAAALLAQPLLGAAASATASAGLGAALGFGIAFVAGGIGQIGVGRRP
jgi:hypothetical protein